MKSLILRLLLWSLIMGASIAYLSGCATKPTKPNTPYQGSYPSGFNELAHNNPLLAKELGKLPEFQDGISDKETIALERIVELYKNNPNSINAAFNLMYRVGIPEVRRYCSPLQAVYWMTEDGKYEELASIIDNYNLINLLNWTWNWNANNYYLKWKNFNLVADRLNAPELIGFYLNRFIVYRTYVPAHGSYMTFKTKKGHCRDAAMFAVDMLKRSGYQTFMRHVIWGPSGWTDQHVGSGIILKDGQYLIVADFNRNGNHFSGPYKTIEEVDNILSGGRIILNRGWGPPK